MRTDLQWIDDILAAIGRIERYADAPADPDVFELVNAWTIRQFQIIGEASRGMSADLRAAHREIPWSRIIGMRNVIVHEYWAVDYDVVWKTVREFLPDFKARIASIASGLPRP